MKYRGKVSGLIGGQRWRLVFVPTILGDEKAYAQTYPLQNEIHVSTDRNKTWDVLRDTLYHELQHATIYAYGINMVLEADTISDRHETFVTLFTPAYITTLKEFGLIK